MLAGFLAAVLEVHHDRCRRGRNLGAQSVRPQAQRMTSFEVWLPLGALALYLFDSTQWLYANELIFLHRGGKWRCAQVPDFLVSGRRVYLPNPLAPATPQFKVRWSESDQRHELAGCSGSWTDSFGRCGRCSIWSTHCW